MRIRVLLRRLCRDETHFLTLSKHFFQRFFDNEFVSRHGEVHLGVVHILSLLAVPGVLYTFFLYSTYDDIMQHHPALFAPFALVDQCRFLTFSMAVTGFAAVLQWDSLFPDRRDYANLATLPLRMPAIFVSKAAALVVFLTLFIVSMNGLTTIFFPMVLTTDRHVPLLVLLGMIWAHGLSVLAGSTFMFLLFIVVQGLLINVLSYRVFRKVSVYVQAVAMVALLSMLFLLPTFSMLLPYWTRQRSLAMYLLPPTWFLGLYQTRLGVHDAFFGSLARLGLLALAVVAVLAAVTYITSYRRHSQGALEAPDLNLGGPERGRSLLAQILDRVLVRKPLERAIFYFVGRTLARSPRHRLYFATWVGVGFALVLEGLVETLARSGHLGVNRHIEALLAVPLVLSFFVLSGMRMVFIVPAELRANWLFQITEEAGRKDCLAGIRKAMLAIGVAPLFASLFPIYGVIWGWTTALLHLVFGLTLALILIEVLLVNFEKIPFTCSYLPGKGNITAFRVLYWLAFSIYAYSMAGLEYWLLRLPILMVMFLVLVSPVLGWLVMRRKRFLAEGFRFVFEDLPEPAVRQLNLSE